VIQGAAGGIFPLAFGNHRDEFPRERVAGAIGLMSALLGVGGGAGVVLAGPIVDHLSFHYLFWLPLIPVVIATVLTHVFVPESPVRVPGRVNWAGAALMSAGLAAVLVAVSETATWHWLSWKTIVRDPPSDSCCSCSGSAATSRSDSPLVDMRMMRIRGVATTNTVALLLGFGMYASFILIPQFVEVAGPAGVRLRLTVNAGRLFLVPTTLALLIVGAQDGSAREALRLEAAAPRGRRPRDGVVPLLTLRARRAVGDLRRGSASRQRHRSCVRAAMANLIIENVGPTQNRRCDRHEHGHAYRRRRLRRRGDASILAASVGVSGFPTGRAYLGGIPPLRRRARGSGCLPDLPSRSAGRTRPSVSIRSGILSRSGGGRRCASPRARVLPR